MSRYIRLQRRVIAVQRVEYVARDVLVEVTEAGEVIGDVETVRERVEDGGVVSRQVASETWQSDVTPWEDA